MTIKDLKPALVFSIFDEINQVPRPSKKEEKIRQYLLDFAAKHNIEVKSRYRRKRRSTTCSMEA